MFYYKVFMATRFTLMAAGGICQSGSNGFDNQTLDQCCMEKARR